MIQIDKGIPLKDRKQSITLEFQEAISKMEKGDSFSFLSVHIHVVRQLYLKEKLKGFGKQFATRKISTTEYRIWRTI